MFTINNPLYRGAVYKCGGGISMQAVQIDIQDRAGKELGKILEAKNAKESALRIHIAGMG
jgi:hypothetical protein